MNRENILYVRSTCSMYPGNPGTRVVKERNVRVTRVTVTLPGSEITSYKGEIEHLTCICTQIN